MQELRVGKECGSSRTQRICRAAGVGTLLVGAYIGLGSGRLLAAQYGPSGQSGQGGSAQTAAPASVARMSFIQGNVQLFNGNESGFEQAVMNMPVVEDTRVQTGGDGQAEIEFNDGSVVRLTPNSAVQVVHLDQDQVQLQQLSGLAYYEVNVGEGHPGYSVLLPNATVEPTVNAIFRVDLDSGVDVALMTGNLHLDGAGVPTAEMSENQSVHFDPNSNFSQFAVVQGFTPDSWDQWNDDRDSQIAEEAAQQTPERGNASGGSDENWSDLDTYGSWYPVPDQGNVWVPSGVGAGWDPFGYGYWGYYPGFGATWISGYPWGWMPYHCGAWNYFSFGWGWMPGGCGQSWVPIATIRNRPPGWFLPRQPIWHGPRSHPTPVQRLVAVDRGPEARGPWGGNGPAPRVNRAAPIVVNGRPVEPLPRNTYGASSFNGTKGTSPGVRTALGLTPRQGYQGQGFAGQRSTFNQQPQVGYAPRSPATPRTTYAPRSQPNQTPHYSPPPHYSSPPMRAPSAPAVHAH